MKRILLFSVLSLLSFSWTMAQSPKWVKKARKAVFSIITYNDKDEILRTGNGFFVDSKGVGVSQYALFEGAQRATIVDADGKGFEVEAIMGVDDLYDVIKFKVAVDKSVEALVVNEKKLNAGDAVYLLGYATQQKEETIAGTIKEVSRIGDYNYYTLNLPLKDKMVSCPIMNQNGEVVGLSQEAIGEEATSISYAVDTNYIIAQSIGALSFNDLSLKKIGIKKALPDTEEEALVFLFIVSSQIQGEEYLSLLNDFIQKFPTNPEGYVRKASYYAFNDINDEANLKEAKDIMAKAVNVATDKSEVYYSYAKLIYNYNLVQANEKPKGWALTDALELIDRGLEINNLSIYLQLKGDIYFADAKYQEAFDIYQQINNSNEATSTSYYSAAKSKELLGAQPEELVVFLDSCIAHVSERPTEEEATYYLERAHVYSILNRHRDALKDYDTFYDVMGGRVNDVFYYLRGQVARDSKLFQKALNDFSEAILISPDEVVYHIELGATNLRVGRNDEAEKIFKEAIKIDPTYAESYRLLGVTQIQLKNNSEACISFNKAKELNDPLVDDLIQKYCK